MRRHRQVAGQQNQQITTGAARQLWERITPMEAVDHIITRPRGITVSFPEDRLDNLRSLYGTHDAQIKKDLTKRGCAAWLPRRS